MDVAVAVRLPDLGRIDVRQPVVGDDLARDVQDQAAERVALVGVRVHAPVRPVEVLVDRALDLDDRLLVLAKSGTLLSVDDVGARRGEVVRRDEHLLDDVLDLLDVRLAVSEAVLQNLDRLGGEQQRLGGVVLPARLPCALDRRADLLGIEGNALAVALDDCRWRDGLVLVHFRPLSFPRGESRRPDARCGCQKRRHHERAVGYTPSRRSASPHCHGRFTGLRITAAVAPSRPHDQWHACDAANRLQLRGQRRHRVDRTTPTGFPLGPISCGSGNRDTRYGRSAG